MLGLFILLLLLLMLPPGQCLLLLLLPLVGPCLRCILFMSPLDCQSLWVLSHDNMVLIKLVHILLTVLSLQMLAPSSA
jgi:hypothetical protein